MVFEDSTGQFHRHPLTKEHSREINDHLYVNIDGYCEYCSTNSPTRYVIDDTCVHCLQSTLQDQASELDKTKFTMDTKQCRGGPHFITRRKGYRRCVICEGIKAALPPSPRQQALNAGEVWYTPDVECKQCGTKSLKRVYDGRCQGCQPVTTSDKPSPRQAALRSGQTWYIPETECPHCHTKAFKRVADGRCQGCVPPKVKALRHDQLLPSDMILTRATAKRLGFKVFRTGRYCSAGHDHFRYTSTGNCITCHLGETS